MKRLFAAILLGSVVLINAAEEKVPTQEQLQTADAQLNQVYQQLRGTLNDTQKQKLKMAQREWIKSRDAFVEANPSNTRGAVYQKTLERIEQLKAANKSDYIQINASESASINHQQSQQIEKKETSKTEEKKDLSEDRKRKNIEIEKAIKECKPLEDRILPQLTEESRERYLIEKENYKINDNSKDADLSIFIPHIKSNPFEYLKKDKENRDFYKNIKAVLKKASEIAPNIIFNRSADEGIKIIPPASLGKTEIFTVTKDQIITIEYNRRCNWDYNSILKIWDLNTGNEIGEIKVVGAIVEVIHSNNSNIITCVTGPIHPKSYDNLGIFNLNLSLLYGKYHIDKEQITSLDSLNQSLIGDTQKAWEFFEERSFNKHNYSDSYNQGIVKADGGYTLYSDGSVFDSTYKKVTQIGGFAKQLNIAAFSISEDGNKLLIMSGKNLLEMNLNTLNLIDKKIKMPYSEMIASGARYTSKFYPNDNIEFINSVNSFSLSTSGNIEFSIIGEPKGRKDCRLRIIKSFVANSSSLVSSNSEIKDEDDVSQNQIVNGAPEILAQTISSKSYINKTDNASISFKIGNSPIFKVDINDVDHKPWIESVAMLNSASKVAVVCICVSGASAGRYYGELDLVDLEKGTILDRWQQNNRISNITEPSFEGPELFNNVKDIYITSVIKGSPVITIVSNAGEITSLDINNKKILSQTSTQVGNIYCGNSASANCSRIAISQSDGGILIYNKNIKGYLEESLRFYPFEDGSWFLYSVTDNYYSYSKINPRSIYFSYKDNFYPFEQYDAFLNRPDILLSRLNAPTPMVDTAKSLRLKKLKRAGLSDEAFKADYHLPEVAITSEIPDKSNQKQINLAIKAEDSRLPISRIKVFLNSVPLNIEGQIIDQKTQSLEKTIPIKLASGRNKIQVSVLNSAGAESLYANAEVNCTADRPKPKLYAVALGVSQYDRPEWCLKYAAKDATDLIGKLKARAGSTYSEVKPLLLTDKEVTKESAAKIKEFLSGATIDDTVLIFMAGHGILDDKYDYYFGTRDIDPAKPAERGMPYEAIDTILAEVPSLRKALLMDTCHAGELDDDEKKELASSDGKGTLPAASSIASDSAIKGTVAMRAIGTRGMTVKAVEGAKGKSDWYEKLQDMFVDLRRGSGATVISSSQGAEYAFESSEQSNGLFTYALMEALDGKATPNKDGQITISAIGDYVKKRVQDLTKGKQNPNLRGVNLEEDFTLSSTK